MVSTFCAHIFALVFWSRILRLSLLTFLGKLYVFPIESAFKYSHQLNRKESSQRDILGKPEIDDVISQGLSRVKFISEVYQYLYVDRHSCAVTSQC